MCSLMLAAFRACPLLHLPHEYPSFQPRAQPVADLWASVCLAAHCGHAAAGLFQWPAAGAHGGRPAGVADGGGDRPAHHWLLCTGGAALYLQVRLGAAARPLRAAAAGAAAGLDSGVPAGHGAGLSCVGAARSQNQHPLHCHAVGAGGVAVGLAGRGVRRLPGRCAHPGRAGGRGGRVGAGVPAGHAGVRRRQLHSGRYAAGLARYLLCPGCHAAAADGCHGVEPAHRAARR